MTGERMITLMLALGVLVSALGVVFTEHNSRLSFSKLQLLSNERDELDINWGRLQLEQSTLATHGRVEGIARSRLDMRLPEHPRLMRLDR